MAISQRHDESWWRQATFEGHPVASALRDHDISLLFRFLRSQGYSRSHLAGCTGLAETRVRAISNGTQHVTAYEVLERIADGLGIPRHMMGLAYDVSPAARNTDYTLPLFTDSPPEVVTPEEVEQIDILSSLLTSWDFAHGGGSARRAAEAHLRWSAGLLRQRRVDGLASDLFCAVARLGAVTGFMNFDADNQPRAQKIFEFSWECAVTAGNVHLQAKLLSHRARQAIWCGSPTEGLQLLDTALRFRGLTPAERAMLHTGRARALAKMGLSAETVAAVAAADEAFDHVGSEPERPWMTYYDQAQHLGDTGHALFGIATSGHAAEEAVRRLRAAVEGHGDAYARSAVQSAVKLASLLMVTGELAEAAELGIRTVRSIGGLKSARVAEGLRELVRLSVSRRGAPPVAELCEAILETNYA